MPLQITCPAHPELPPLHGREVFDHASEFHPGEKVQDVSNRMIRKFVSQARAQGNTEVRIVHCRTCAKAMTYRIGPGEVVEIFEQCEEHRG